MDLMARALRWLLRGVRKGEPGTIVGSGVLMMLLWLRRNPRRRLHLGSYDLAPGEDLVGVEAEIATALAEAFYGEGAGTAGFLEMTLSIEAWDPGEIDGDMPDTGL